MAVKRVSHKIVAHLLSHNANVNLADFDGQTPLHHAVKSLAPQTMTYLLACPDVKLDILNSSEETPLIVCAKLVDHKQVIHLAIQLIDAGTSLENISTDSGINQYILHICASYNNVELIRVLIEKGANKDVTDSEVIFN